LYSTGYALKEKLSKVQISCVKKVTPQEGNNDGNKSIARIAEVKQNLVTDVSSSRPRKWPMHVINMYAMKEKLLNFQISQVKKVNCEDIMMASRAY
jgi:hypothetical protein